jgi:hypothetical protein
MTPDQINSIFPFVGCFVILLNIRKLYLDKEVKGIHWFPPLFFYCGQAWGVYFLYTLDQWYSLIAGFIFLMFSLLWYSMMIYFKINSTNGE